VIDHKIIAVMNHPYITVYLNTEIDQVHGYVGNFETTIQTDGKEVKLNFGSVIVATGLKPFDVKKVINYGYGKLFNVVTSLEFEQVLKSGIIITRDGEYLKTLQLSIAREAGTRIIMLTAPVRAA